MLKKLILFCLLAVSFNSNDAYAKFPPFRRNKAKADTTATTKKVKEPAPTKGFFYVQKNKDDWYFQIHDTLLNKPFLAVTRFVSTPVEMGTYGGELVSSQMFYWQKQGSKLYLRALIHDATCDPQDAISKALQASTEDPLVASFKIEKEISVTSKDSASQDSTIKVKYKRYSIKVTEFLKDDNIVTGFSSNAKTKFKLSGFKGDLSYVDKVSTYPTNVEVSTLKTYTGKSDNKAWSSKIVGNMTFRMNTSFVMLPQTPMRQRIADARVGYFLESDRLYSDDQQSVRRRQYATRWRLEPKNDEDAARQAKGKLIEPKKPIVYYIDPATPKQWRPYLKQGVNDWNVAFEQAGWKNAIRAEEWPDDPDMSLEDARFSVIRYLASPIKNAYGPHISDPRTGEILNSCIGWYHNVMELIHDWYMVQASAVDPRARTMQLPDELMGELIRFVSSHEVGHTLGLRHNMGASSCTPVDSLRNKRWVEKNGHTVSIMDYARFNYVAQPEDGIDAAGRMPRINVYDKWAIEWGYKYFANAKSAEEERLLLNKITTRRLKADRRLWFGGEGKDNDPRALTEDLGDDPMKAAEYGILNLKRIIKNLPQWTKEEADQYENLEQVYSSLIAQYRRYIGHATSNIAGVYHEYKSVEQDGAVYMPAEKARTRKALDFLEKYALTEPRWLIDEPFLYKISQNPSKRIRSIVENTTSYLVSVGVLTRVYQYSGVNGAYEIDDYVDDVVKILFKDFSSTAKLSQWRMAMHRSAIRSLIMDWMSSSSEDVHPYITYMLDEAQRRLRTATSADKATKAHYRDLLDMIQTAREK